MKLKFTLAVFCLAFIALAQTVTNYSPVPAPGIRITGPDPSSVVYLNDLLIFETSAETGGSNWVNYDEAKVGTYTLPDPLVCADGTRVTSAKIWEEIRRPEVVKLFEEHVYGRAPGRPDGEHFELTSLTTNALGGLATRKEVTLWFTPDTNGPRLYLLLYLPNAARQPAPAFLGLNFSPNARQGRFQWPVETVLARGYALAVADYNDVEPDVVNGWKRGVRAAMSPDGTNTVFKPDDWGAISAWAWGLSRALDYLETDHAVDAKRVAVIGHSRLGKTALWAGAHDQRFALAISNESGEGGASLARRWFGETTMDWTREYSYWFCANYLKYAGHDDELPVDQHELIALMVPRPVYIASADGDLSSDPRGEFLAGKGAEPVYQLYGETGLGVTDWPTTNHPVGDFIGYHLRSGKHAMTTYDWEQYLNFADRHLKQ